MTKTKQLSNCCKAGIKLTGRDRPNAFACEKCGRIIGTPIKKTKNETKERFCDTGIPTGLEYL